MKKGRTPVCLENLFPMLRVSLETIWSFLFPGFPETHHKQISLTHDLLGFLPESPNSSTRLKAQRQMLILKWSERPGERLGGRTCA